MTRYQRRFLAGIATAPGINRALVTHPDLDRQIDFGGDSPSVEQQESAARDLERKRQFARTYGSVALQGREVVVEGRFHSWDELLRGTVAWMVEHLSGLDWQELAARTGGESQHLREGSEEAMQDGIATVCAIQEVVPRVLAHRRFDDPDSDIAFPWIARTKGLAMEWMGLHDKTDYRLAWALSRHKPPGPNVFSHLRLIPELFVADDGEKLIMLNETAVPHLLARDGLPPEAEHNPGEALFGCPGRMLIPAIYDAMTVGAATNGLIAQSYWDERNALGYIDAARYR